MEQNRRSAFVAGNDVAFGLMAEGLQSRLAIEALLGFLEARVCSGEAARGKIVTKERIGNGDAKVRIGNGAVGGRTRRGKARSATKPPRQPQDRGRRKRSL